MDYGKYYSGGFRWGRAGSPPSGRRIDAVMVGLLLISDIGRLSNSVFLSFSMQAGRPATV